MQFKTLTLLATLTPLPAAAFGDLDCITLEACGTSQNGGGCAPATAPFSITFNWADDAIDVQAKGDTHTLPWTHTGETEDGLASVLEYDGEDRSVRIEANGADITAFYTFPQSGVTTWVGTCDVRQAA